jgi:hypothetical protein
MIDPKVASTNSKTDSLARKATLGKVYGTRFDGR